MLLQRGHVRLSAVVVGIGTLLLGSAVSAAAPGPRATGTAHARRAQRAPGVVRLLTLDSPQIAWLVVGQRPSLASPIAVYRTVDGGRHWTQEATGAPGHPVFGAGQLPVAIDFPGPETGYAVVNAGAGACQASYAVYATSDGGAHFRLQSRLIGSDGPVAVYQQAVHAPLWLANGSCAAATTAVWLSHTDGLHWTAPVVVQGPPEAKGGGPTAVALVPTAKGVELVASYARYATNGSPLAAYLTVSSWPFRARVTHVLPFREPPSALAFANATRGWAATRTGLYQTANGGATWTVVPSPVPFRQLTAPPTIAVTLAPSGLDGWLAAGSHLWVTGDGGRRWQAIPVP